MPNFYAYLIASLPMLHFNGRAPLGFEKFLKNCELFIPERDLEILKTASISGEYNYENIHPFLRGWHEFDTDLRNELVKVRASRRRVDASKYSRRERYVETTIAHLAINAHRSLSPLEGERMLDNARWQKLEESSFGHYFDLEFLLIYALKLLILERWERIHTADKISLLQETLSVGS